MRAWLDCDLRRFRRCGNRCRCGDGERWPSRSAHAPLISPGAKVSEDSQVDPTAPGGDAVGQGCFNDVEYWRIQLRAGDKVEVKGSGDDRRTRLSDRVLCAGHDRQEDRLRHVGRSRVHRPSTRCGSRRSNRDLSRRRRPELLQRHRRAVHVRRHGPTTRPSRRAKWRLPLARRGRRSRRRRARRR